MSDPKVISTTIPDNQALSGAVDLGHHKLIALELPETFNTTTLTFQAKAKRVDDEVSTPEDWDNVYTDAGTEFSITVAAGRVVVLVGDKREALSALRYIRVRSGTAASPVNINPGGVIRFICK